MIPFRARVRSRLSLEMTINLGQYGPLCLQRPGRSRGIGCKRPCAIVGGCTFIRADKGEDTNGTVAPRASAL
jgi:hypothetical protein